MENKDLEGLVGVSDNLSVDNLVVAYRSGIFPWPISRELPVTWFSPDPRGILDYKDLHISKSLKKVIKKKDFQIKYNQDFSLIIRSCAKTPRTNQKDSWITEPIIKSYEELYQRGLAYCVGAYQKDKLVGGIYGVCIEGIVSGESMFFHISNASKVALVCLMEILHSAGIVYLDTQMLTTVVQDLGGKNISKKEFLERLKNRNHKNVTDIF